MSLQFVVGNAGSGKSTYLYRYVTEQAMMHPKKNYLVVVPEQFTMHTQQQLVEMHPAHGIMNIDVLSFERMAYRVFDELGTDTLEVLEETGKHLLLRKIAQDKKEELPVLGKNMRKSGYVAQIKSLISELMQYDISPEDFEEMAAGPMMSEAFRRKAEDILTIYREYCERLQGRYITTEEILQKLMDVAERSKILAGATVVFDGFTGFTPIQNQFLQMLLTIAEKVMVTVTCDSAEALLEAPQEHELFAMSKQMTVRLAKMARAAGVETEPVVLMKDREHQRFVRGGYLEHLEQNLFRFRGKAFAGDGEKRDGLELVSLASPRQELTYVACEIERQVREREMRYGDFAVVCADMNAYAHLVPGIFDRLHMPFFLDAKSEIVFHPFIESIKSLFAMLDENYSYESVMRLLRSGMTDLSMAETDAFDNYLLASGVRGWSKYRETFAYLPTGYTAEQLVYLNRIREKFIAPLKRFHQEFAVKRGDAASISAALYQWICHYGMEARLRELADDFAGRCEEVKAREYGQIYGVVMGLLDKLVALLGDEEMTFAEYADLLSTGFESLRVGVIPPGNDRVVIGDMERTRLADIRVMYLIGAHDGAIPKSVGNGGILSQLERQQLKDASYELAPTDREKSFMQRFYLYFVMTKPSEKLVVTHARVDGNGKAVRPSYLIADLQKLFPKLTERTLEELPREYRMLTREMAREYLMEDLRLFASEGTLPAEAQALLAWEKRQGDTDILQWVDAAFFVHKKERLSAAAIDAVFGRNMGESVSRMEQYARCAYAYFLKYGLRLQPRQEHEFATVDIGNLYHHALEYYSMELQKREDADWYTVSEEQMHALLEEAIAHAYRKMTKTQLLENARDAYRIHQMRLTLQQTVWALTEQVRRGSFVPTAFEVDFCEVGDLESLTFQIDEMHTMRLRGKIDRMDLYQTDDCVYVKIVDYKSGNKDFDFQQLYHGLQVQLVLYLNAAMEGLQQRHPGKEVRPGAMFYYHIDRPLVRADEARLRGGEQAILKELRVKGFLNRDDEVIRALDHDLQGASDVIPLKRKKDSEPDANSHVISDDEFAVLSDYVQMLMEECGRSIVQGDVDCSPCKLNQTTGCDYCEYHAVCGFDSGMAGYGYRCLKSPKERTVLIERMRQDLESYHARKEKDGT